MTTPPRGRKTFSRRPRPADADLTAGAALAEPDLAELVDRRLAEMRERDRLDREREALRRRLADSDRTHRERLGLNTGGPCSYCGTVYSLRWSDVVNGRVACLSCLTDWQSHPDDAEHRSLVINRLASGASDTDQVRFVCGDMATQEARAVGFRWFHEVSDTQPGREPFTYVDLPRLREAHARHLAPTPPVVPTLRDGDPCPLCGCAHMWVQAVVLHTHPDGVEHRVTTTECAGCGRLRDVLDLATRALGLSYSGALHARAHGLLPAYDELPADDRRRRLTQAPFAYLGEVGELRLRIFAVLSEPTHWASARVLTTVRADYVARGGALPEAPGTTEVPFGRETITYPPRAPLAPPSSAAGGYR